jgi:hypothetical protein
MIDELVKGFKIDLPPASSSLLGPTPPRLSAYLPLDQSSASGDAAWDEKRALVASSSAGFSGKGRRILSFVPPTAGQLKPSEAFVQASLLLC